MPKSSVKFAPDTKKYSTKSFNIFNILDQHDDDDTKKSNQKNTSHLPPIHSIVWGKTILNGKSWADEVEGF
jgi:hypothetical protein